MNARSYRTGLSHSKIDFPATNGLAETAFMMGAMPPSILQNKIVLKLVHSLILNPDTNAKHTLFEGQSNYEIPTNVIKTRSDVYEFFKDSVLGFSEVYALASKDKPFPPLSFPTAGIETFKREIDGVFYLLDAQN